MGILTFMLLISILLLFICLSLCLSSGLGLDLDLNLGLSWCPINCAVLCYCLDCRFICCLCTVRLSCLRLLERSFIWLSCNSLLLFLCRCQQRSILTYRIRICLSRIVRLTLPMLKESIINTCLLGFDCRQLFASN